ncbi:MAG: aminotransferase class I/II-fold pyridoxal phosphate-dependent enzyme [Cyanobacteriota bacterium]
MLKKFTSSGSYSTTNKNERDLASHPRGVATLIDNAFELDFDHSIELQQNKLDYQHPYPETPILDALEKYLESSTVNLHIPGHSQGAGILPRLKDLLGDKAVKADTTDDFDGLGQLNPPEGPIKEAQDLAAKTFGVKHTFFLINGSTVGNLALAMTITKPGEKVAIARNCHRSVISGIATSGAVPLWIMPERIDEWGVWGALSPDKVEKMLDDNPDVATLWVTNPTYEGVVSDIKAISKICKNNNVRLIVDEAHGSHWKFNNNLPDSSVNFDVDAVVHSIHKTAGSFSQSSMLHLPVNSKIDYDELSCNLRMLQSTSPSYLLLASLDAARAFIESQHGRYRLAKMVYFSEFVRYQINQIPGCRCLAKSDSINIDPTKIYIIIDGLSGRQLKDILEFEFHIETEAKTDNGVLALANIGNTTSELEYFLGAIKNIASRKEHYVNKDKPEIKFMPFSIPEMVCIPREAYFCKKEKILPKDAIGRISSEILAICPPGIPVLVPGERIQKEHLVYLKEKEYIWVVSE